MKFHYLLLIILLIIAAHVAVIILCFRNTDDSPAKNTPKVEKTETSQKEEQTAQTAAVPEKKTDTASAANEAPIQKKKMKSHRMIHFSYKFAWNGNIPELPDSAKAKGGILVDLTTGNVLWNKNANKVFRIASMTKIMTLLLACEDVESGRNGVSLSSLVKVTPGATNIGGSQVWLDPKETFSLEDLLKAVAIKSANDAAYLVGEYLGQGNIRSFIVRMNQRAAELSLRQTHFYNSNGLPERNAAHDNVSSPENMAHLAIYAIQYENMLKWASTLKTDFRKPGTRGYMIIENHNHLLPGKEFGTQGVDGLKTGMTNRAGFCTTATCKRGDHRMIAVVMGFDSWRNRDRFVGKLLNWGYARRANPAAGLEQSRKAAVKKKSTPPSRVRKPVKKTTKRKK